MDHVIVTLTVLVRKRDDIAPTSYVSQGVANKSDVLYIYSAKERLVEAGEWAEYKAETSDR